MIHRATRLLASLVLALSADPALAQEEEKKSDGVPQPTPIYGSTIKYAYPEGPAPAVMKQLGDVEWLGTIWIQSDGEFEALPAGEYRVFRPVQRDQAIAYFERVDGDVVRLDLDHIHLGDHAPWLLSSTDPRCTCMIEDGYVIVRNRACPHHTVGGVGAARRPRGGAAIPASG